MITIQSWGYFLNLPRNFLYFRRIFLGILTSHKIHQAYKETACLFLLGCERLAVLHLYV